MRRDFARVSHVSILLARRVNAFHNPTAMPLPEARGLYRPEYEHDACGLGFVATLKRTPTHDVVSKALEVLARLAHRGAAGCDPCSGDGSGILLQIPHAFYERAMAREGFDLPLPGDYAVIMCFLPRDEQRCDAFMAKIEAAVHRHGQKIIGWRDVPTDDACIGPVARASMPAIKQLFVGRMCPVQAFERTLFMIRKRAEKTIAASDVYIASCSSKTVVYKGLMLPEHVGKFFPDLGEDDVRSSLALVHSRFSTNTFPTWERAHPYRRLAHNGEINTLQGNKNWMRAREALLQSQTFGEYIEDFKPIITPGGSDSGSLDDVIDFLCAGGRSLPHVMMMLVPEALTPEQPVSENVRGFYDYHSLLVEPWDGPAALCFTDGSLIGASLDRNGLRPLKYLVTESGYVVMASEFGVLDFDPADVVEKGRVKPGKMLLIDTKKGQVLRDEQVKEEIASQKPYGAWVKDQKRFLEDLPRTKGLYSLGADDRRSLQQAFGYTREDLSMVLAPMAANGEEPIGSMGTDTPLAVLSTKPQSLFRYFKQHFAQVTNPPIDPIREELVMSLAVSLGGEGNLLAEEPEQARQLELPHPVLAPEDLASIEAANIDWLRVVKLDATFDVAAARKDPAGTFEATIMRLCAEASKALDDGAGLVVVSDRQTSATRAPVPSLLAVSAVHQSLVKSGDRVKVGLVCETAEAREVADFALLIGYGASAVAPYLAFETLHELVAEGRVEGVTDAKTADKHYVKAIKKGLLKVMSKMGISCLSSYQGAMIFESIGISNEIVNTFFSGTPNTIGGIGAKEIIEEALARHALGYVHPAGDLDVGGRYHWRRDGEKHLWSPESVSALQKAVRLSSGEDYDRYANEINEQTRQPVTVRGLWDLKSDRAAIPVSDVESASQIVRRFATGAMSFGSISSEAHENLAIAMNRIGARSNTGEGGEDEARFTPEADGTSRRSSIKQVASGRFGVTAHYLANADELQIKVAQGAKPGEGGQLPGHKVDAIIAKVRHSTPGVTLISPPPHHDIYSIEDLAQLIFDLKNVNPRARISVKLVSEAGVGTIAAGVAKAHADVILIAGHDGGTGASPLSSIQHAGTPWELGLAETQQILVKNGLRDRVVVQADGQLKTGRDVAFAALLGAEEFGFATAPLVASGCIMMRKCHLNTCPVGIATQDPVLKARFKGTPEHVVNYFFFVAEELRRIMAELGFRTVDEMVGRADCVVPRAMGDHPKAHTLDFRDLLHVETQDEQGQPAVYRCTTSQDHGIATVIDQTLIRRARASLENREATTVAIPIENSNRAFGAMLSGEVAARYGAEGLPDGTITVVATGTAGQAFGAFVTRGITITLEGDANDYVGKGLSGGVLAVRPPSRAKYKGEENVIVGNTCLYGATSGRAFFAGRGGERFAVRNSGATAIVEGVGDHGCEYMTGGTVVVLGLTGRNFGAGMSGGLAYVYDEDGAFASRCNKAMIELESLADTKEIAALESLIEEHVSRTGSAKGSRLLDDWASATAKFVRVVPTEYKKILAQKATEARQLKVVS
jgi:glutamate synthase (NADPH) large chain